jgi:hypothetical protein
MRSAVVGVGSFALGTAIGAAIVNAQLGHVSLESLYLINWGSVGEWVGGVGTAAAVIFAVTEARAQRLAEGRRAAESRQSAALAITARLEDAVLQAGGTSFSIHVSNGSGTPIFGVEAQLSLGGDPIGVVSVGTVGASRTESAPGFIRRKSLDTSEVRIALRFRDIWGANWVSNGGIVGVDHSRGSESSFG